MSHKIFITRKIPDVGIKMLEEKGYEVDVSSKDGVLTRDELKESLQKKEYDAVLCLLTDKIDGEVFDWAPKAKIFANYAVGYNNIDIEEAKKRGLIISNTPGVLTETVAEYAFALLMAVTKRIAEADRFTRNGDFVGWAPELLLGAGLQGKTLGIIGAGRIGSRVAFHAKNGFEMEIIYYDVKKSEVLENELDAKYFDSVDEVLKQADFVSVHVPLLDSTKHLINKERLSLMKSTSYLINTSRGAVVDEEALVEALREKKIKGAGLDVFEDEPALKSGLNELDNVVLTPHIASGTEETRSKMSQMAAQNIIDLFEERTPQNLIKELS